MKIYLAHNFAARIMLRDIVVPLFEAHGHEITSNWIKSDSHVTGRAVDCATEDLANINTADALVLFTDQYGMKPGRGKFLELGFAIALGKECFIIGEDCTGSVFFHLDEVVALDTVSDLLNHLKEG